jgi:hypothetical protein
MPKLLRDEIENRFVRTLVEAGVTHEEMEQIVLSPHAVTFGKRLKPYVTMFAKETSIDHKEPVA